MIVLFVGQSTVDSLIKQSGANPLALASLALAVGEKDRHDERKWIAVEEDLAALLEEETLPQHLMYPTSVASSIMLALKAVPSEALELLYLASLCEGPVVPELVTRIFYFFLNGGSSKFIQWTNFLENSSLVQVHNYEVQWSTGPRQKTWSVHSLRQLFIREKKTKELETLTDRLLGLVDEGKVVSEETQDLVIALTAVYGDVGDRAAKSLGITVEQVFERKTFIKELVWLLDGESKERWRRQSHHLGNKV